jgi:hypothetical protein
MSPASYSSSPLVCVEALLEVLPICRLEGQEENHSK